MSIAEILIILVVVLIVLGPERLPELARMLGKGMREVRKASNMFRDTFMLEEQQGHPTRPDQMMQSPETAPPSTQNPSASSGEPTSSVDRLSEHATPWEDFETVVIAELSPAARVDVTTRRSVDLQARRTSPDESAVALDPPLPPSVW
jgi:sec-independent protein translocase protein TatB